MKIEETGLRIEDRGEEPRIAENCAENPRSTPLNPVSSILHPQSSILYPQSSILNPVSTILNPEVRFLGLADYASTWQAMQQFTAQRTPATRDEIWILQHPPTYTQGQAGKPEHLLNARQIPVVQIDRGGQITYHGPGQIVAYLLLDLRRWKINVRELVRLMEQSVINILADYNIAASGRVDAPGVYVGDAKIAALGLKIKQSCCYHGLSFNIDMDLTPYDFINPCGYTGLRVTQLKDFGVSSPIDELQAQLARNLVNGLDQHLTRYLSTELASPHGKEIIHRRDAALEEKLTNYARELRAASSGAEQRIWYLLRSRNFLGYKFRRQHPVGNYILDFYCADVKLAIELDGGQHAENVVYDLQRTETLMRDGIQVLRFWNNDVLMNTEAVLSKIADVLIATQNSSLQTAPSPQPSPREQCEGARNTGQSVENQSSQDNPAKPSSLSPPVGIGLG
jgi:lipoyl(octanoyl) transferase